MFQFHSYRIMAFLPAPSVSILTDRVAYADSANQFLNMGDSSNIGDQTRFVISNMTQILDHKGNAIPLPSLRPGQMVRVEYGDFQSPMIPPQTPAYLIQLLSD